MSEAAEHEPSSGRSARFPRWKKGLLAVALVLMAVGGSFALYDAIATPTPEAPSSAEQPAGARDDLPKRGLLPEEQARRTFPQLPTSPDESEGPPTDGGDGAVKTDGGSEPLWAGALFKLGFGFFVGFAIGYAVRMFFRISLVAVGLVLLVLFGLQYAGLITVDWSAMETAFNGFAEWVRANAAGFRAFIAGQLPSAASALGGAVIGFKK